MKFLILAALILTPGAKAHARDIALTFDDCPRKTDKLMTGMERAKKITDQLKKSEVKQVAFFCNSPSRMTDGKERLEHFAAEGHIIANHSANHDDLNTTDVQLYTQRIGQAHDELKGFSNFRKWFRYPYLREGKTPEKINAVRSYLAKTGYLNAYVTVDNADWYMDDLLVKAVAAGKKYNVKKLCGAYKSIIGDEADFYDDISLKALGRSVKHVLLLHETDLNALCIGEVILELRRRGWNIISPDEAYADPIAMREPSVHVRLNQGRVVALAEERGYKGRIYSKWNERKDIEAAFKKRGAWN